MSTLLTYDINSSPDPLQIDATGASITVIASNPGRAWAQVSKIEISIPIGTGSASVTNDASAITAVAPEGWTAEPYQNDGSFTFNAAANSPGVTGGLAFVFSGITVNGTLGTAQVLVNEWSGDNGADNSLDLAVSKFPAQFYLNDLTATPSAVSSGLCTVLGWDGSPGYDYALTPLDLLPGAIPVDENTGSITSNPLVQNAIFTLTVTNSSGNDPFQANRSVGVTVTPPSVDSFTINGGTDPVTVDLGDTVSFDWTVSNATNVQLLADNVEVGLFPVSTGGVDIIAEAAATYTIVAYFGTPQDSPPSYPSSGLQILLNPPQILSFSTNAAYVYADYNANALTLNWQVKNATSLMLQIGEDAGTFPLDISVTSYAITPSTTTQYTLYAVYDPSEASSSVSPSADLSNAATADTSGEKQTVTQVISLPMHPCPLDITYNIVEKGGSNTRALGKDIYTYSFGIAGFDVWFSDDDNHNLKNWKIMTTVTKPDAQSLTVAANIVLSDSSSHSVDSKSSVSVLTICNYDGDNGSGFYPGVSNWQAQTATLPGTGYGSEIYSALAGWSLSSQSDDDGEVKKLKTYINQPDDITPNTDTDETTASVSGVTSASGEEDYYWSVTPGVLGRRSPNHGTGFQIKKVSNNTASVDFDHPVQTAYTMLTSWENDGDGDNHEIAELSSPIVAATCDGSKTVKLDWGTSQWVDSKHHGPWNSTRAILVIAAFANQR